jgi:hypothetical protein
VLLGAAMAVDMNKSIASSTPDRRVTRGTPVAAALVASAALMVMSTVAATALCAWLTPPWSLPTRTLARWTFIEEMM